MANAPLLPPLHSCRLGRRTSRPSGRRARRNASPALTRPCASPALTTSACAPNVSVCCLATQHAQLSAPTMAPRRLLASSSSRAPAPPPAKPGRQGRVPPQRSEPLRTVPQCGGRSHCKLRHVRGSGPHHVPVHSVSTRRASAACGGQAVCQERVGLVGAQPAVYPSPNPCSSRCRPGFFLVDNACVSCGVDFCDVCASATECAECMEGYQTVQGPPVSCVKCAVGECANCDSDAIQCDQCKPGYRYNAEASTCEQVGCSAGHGAEQLGRGWRESRAAACPAPCSATSPSVPCATPTGTPATSACPSTSSRAQCRRSAWSSKQAVTGSSTASR